MPRVSVLVIFELFKEALCLSCWESVWSLRWSGWVSTWFVCNWYCSKFTLGLCAGLVKGLPAVYLLVISGVFMPSNDKCLPGVFLLLSSVTSGVSVLVRIGVSRVCASQVGGLLVSLFLSQGSLPGISL